MTREPIYEALLARLQSLTDAPYNLPLRTVSRGFIHWTDCQNQPAIFVVPVNETAEYQRPLPTKWKMSVDVWVYVMRNGTDIGVKALSAILDGVESVLSPTGAGMTPPGFTNNLGGLVQRCAISGAIEISGGYLGDQTVARVPVEIIVA